MVTERENREVVIVGGGYAGMMAALRLAGRTKRAGVGITLVNASDRFVERIRLHQLATGQRLKDRSIVRMLRGTGVTFLQGTVLALDPDARSVAVETAEGRRTLGYDALIYALGSTIDTTSVAGVREHALTLGGESAALALRDRLAELSSGGGRLLVCGGGLTGIEAASEIAESWPAVPVGLVTSGRIGAGLSEKGRRHVKDVFARRSVEVREGAAVRRVGPAALELEDGATLPFDACLWAGAFSAPALARQANLAVNERGQMLLDPCLRSLSHPEVFGAGDAAIPVEPPGVPLRMACATALPFGAQAAENVAALLLGHEPEPFRFVYAIQCISLGRKDGLIQLVHRDDSPRERVVTGRPAALLKEAICRFGSSGLAFERRVTGSVRWLKGSTTEQPSRAEALLPAGRNEGALR